jgi:hypothetical protein
VVATTTAAGTLAMGPVVGALAPRRAIQVAGLVVGATVASSAAAYAAHLFKARAADNAGSAADACDPRRTIVIGRAATRWCPVTRLLFEDSSPLRAPLGRALDLAPGLADSLHRTRRWSLGKGLLGLLPTLRDSHPGSAGQKNDLQNVL